MPYITFLSTFIYLHPFKPLFVLQSQNLKKNICVLDECVDKESTVDARLVLKAFFHLRVIHLTLLLIPFSPCYIYTEFLETKACRLHHEIPWQK
jgi:hypothetical protein